MVYIYIYDILYKGISAQGSPPLVPVLSPKWVCRTHGLAIAFCGIGGALLASALVAQSRPLPT